MAGRKFNVRDLQNLPGDAGRARQAGCAGAEEVAETIRRRRPGRGDDLALWDDLAETIRHPEVRALLGEPQGRRPRSSCLIPLSGDTLLPPASSLNQLVPGPRGRRV